MLIVGSMRDFYNKLCLLILEEHFGPLIKCIGNNLLHGTKTLRAICFGTRLPLAKVKEGLCVLIKYGYVTCQQIEEDDTIEYSLDHDKIIMILRYPRYMFFTKTYCGDEGEIMLEEILKHGYLTASEVIIKTYKRVEKASNKSDEDVSLPNLKDAFELLVKNQFLMRSVSFDTAAKETEKPDYNLPELDLRAIHYMMQGQEADPGDGKVYWKVNVDRFTQDFRDQIVVSAMTQRFNDSAGKLMRQLINLMYVRTASWSDTSNPIPYTEIKEAVKKLDCPELEQYLDQYLQMMEEDSSQFVRRVGDSGGGQYSINMKNAFKQLAWVTLENIVTERFGSKAARIFRLVRMDSGVTLEQIQQMAMIPAKEAKFFAYTLVQENYIQIQELKKGGSSAVDSRKASFRFCIDLPTVVEMEMEHCCQALYNIIQRRSHESTSNRRMIEKQLRVQILSANMREHGATEQQLADIADMMTPSENEQLEKAQKAIKGLAAAEFHIDETLFLLTMYVRYH
ncbi:hypothetical protein DMN91_004693 [Ooceraea biroi]|uniref:DNA-directed RNA polymerase III subunit RPC3 n=1 Tax=Ooceraea biroi TaxID=2015173 RepID=A0A026VTN7_OOCBI|nr:DNA-directed RNA polymerase III subunit RPC3 isoform X2 [Ooceraea biroi]EZA46881.1 DNA-directed RNA polymerase III subunit RPC3 [Ooceraea biroi]RLU22415.1 hypothetical protein DMN91_004693 [Ooceraea biroi]